MDDPPDVAKRRPRKGTGAEISRPGGKARIIDRFREAPRDFLRRYRGVVQAPLFRDLADAAAIQMVGSPATAEEHVLAIQDLAKNVGSCALSRAYGLLSSWRTFTGSFDAALADAEAAVESAAECPYCLANSYKVRGNVLVEQCLLEGCSCAQALPDLELAALILKDVDDLPGYGGVLIIRGKALAPDWSAPRRSVRVTAAPPRRRESCGSPATRLVRRRRSGRNAPCRSLRGTTGSNRRSRRHPRQRAPQGLTRHGL